DGAIPSGNGVATLALLSLSEHTGKTLYRERAEAAMKAFAAEFKERPAPLRTLALAVDLYHRTSPAPGAPSMSGASRKQELEPVARLAEELVKTALLLEDAPAGGGRWRPFELRVTIREGWHVNAHPASLRYLIPTEVRGDVRKLTYPEGEDFKFAFSEESLSVYSDTVSIRGEIDPQESELRLVYQACDDRRCLAPVDKTIPVPPE
ncbi:MAG TPA: protein-disulfide reductase DsbD domain-containing protein, partial [Vicinamibacteria bacterium]|nr:protein-disulfide reductase DsbD domain-containing protein [Vicinamibacteria bacterium]